MRCLLLLVATVASAMQVTRRNLLPAAATATAPVVAAPGAALAKDRSEGYAVQKSPQDWQRQLSGPQYFVLRSGGTEPPNSSPLVKEKRAGTFACAGCGAKLFESSAKFESGTQGRKRVIQRLFNVGVLEAMSEKKASTL